MHNRRSCFIAALWYHITMSPCLVHAGNYCTSTESLGAHVPFNWASLLRLLTGRKSQLITRNPPWKPTTSIKINISKKQLWRMASVLKPSMFLVGRSHFVVLGYWIWVLVLAMHFQYILCIFFTLTHTSRSVVSCVCRLLIGIPSAKSVLVTATCSVHCRLSCATVLMVNISWK